MNKFGFSAVVAAAVFSASAFAGHDCDEDDGRYERSYRRSVSRVIVYDEPRVVYREAPPVVYRERIVLRDRPVYDPRPAARYYEDYEEAEGGYDEVPPRYSGYEERAMRGARRDDNRAFGQVVGAIAGGVIGNQIGRGNGRVAATAIGAVLGGVVGGQVADDWY